MGNDRYAGVRRLPDAPIAGESYRNAGSHYKVWQYNAAADTAHVENLTSGWVCTAHTRRCTACMTAAWSCSRITAQTDTLNSRNRREWRSCGDGRL